MAEARRRIDETTGGPRGRWVLVVVVVFLTVQLLLPLRYYLGDQRTDERFAWRMFSSVRMSQNKATLYETIERDGGLVEERVPAATLSHWQAQLDRGKGDVVRKMMRWLGERPGVVSVRYELRSRTPDGREVEPMVWRLDRATGRIEEIDAIGPVTP